jgi:hypothetical protein
MADETGLLLAPQLKAMLGSEAYHYCADCHSHCRQTVLAVEAAKEAVKAHAADAEQLHELRAEALKGICVYCGEIQQYESLEQKGGEEGNQIRVAHIRQCLQRPELKLIAYCEELQDAANAAFQCLCGTGELTIEQVKDALFAVLNPKPAQETR